jgi:hypothetical protein
VGGTSGLSRDSWSHKLRMPTEESARERAWNRNQLATFLKFISIRPMLSWRSVLRSRIFTTVGGSSINTTGKGELVRAVQRIGDPSRPQVDVQVLAFKSGHSAVGVDKRLEWHQRRPVRVHASASPLVHRSVVGVSKRARCCALREIPQIWLRPCVRQAAFRAVELMSRLVRRLSRRNPKAP